MNMNSKVALLTVALLAPAFMNASEESTVKQNYVDDQAEEVGCVYRNSITNQLVMVDKHSNQFRMIERPATPAESEDAPKTSFLQKWMPTMPTMPAMDKKNLLKATSLGLGALAVLPCVYSDHKYASEAKQAQGPLALAALASGYAAYATPSSSVKALASAEKIAVEEVKA